MEKFSKLMRQSIFLEIAAAMIAYKIVDTACTIVLKKFK